MAWVRESAIAAITEVPAPGINLTCGQVSKVNRGVYTGTVGNSGEVSYWSSLYGDVVGLGRGI